MTQDGRDMLDDALTGADGADMVVTATLATKAEITINGVPLEEPSVETNWGGIIVTKISGEDEE